MIRPLFDPGDARLRLPLGTHPIAISAATLLKDEEGWEVAPLKDRSATFVPVTGFVPVERIEVG